MILNENTGVIEIKQMEKAEKRCREIRVPGDKNNNAKIEILSDMTIDLPSTSTSSGKRSQMVSFFRPHVRYPDSDDDMDNEDKENKPQISVKINDQKQSAKKQLKRKGTKLQTTTKDTRTGSKKSKSVSNGSDCETDISDKISIHDSSDDSEEVFMEEDEIFMEDNDIDEMAVQENDKKTKINEEYNGEFGNENNLADLKSGMYVVVKFETKKGHNKYYVGKVTKTDGILIRVNYMRKKKCCKNENIFSWPQVKD